MPLPSAPARYRPSIHLLPTQRDLMTLMVGLMLEKIYIYTVLCTCVRRSKQALIVVVVVPHWKTVFAFPSGIVD